MTLTAAELAKGRALREAERDKLWQSRTTHALSDWLDRHCDDLIEAAEALAEKDAQIAALQKWRNAALRVGEDLALDGPNGYYSFTASQYLDWALARLRETPAPPQEHLSGVNDDYYMPGHKDETKGDPMTDPIIDVQQTLDDWLDSNPDAQLYVRKIYYLPDGSEIPREVTHMNRLTSVPYPNLDLRLGVVATAKTAALANVILGLIERSAGDRPTPKA